VRFVVTAVLWLATTVALAVAVPALWAQLNIVSEDGYSAMAQQAAADPTLQSAVASELTARAMALIAERGGGHYSVDSSQVHAAAAAFTAGREFPPLFTQVNRAAHTWLFAAPGQNGGQWVVDLAPMLNDPSLQEVLNSHNVKAPASLTVPLTAPQPLRQGQLNRLATWGPWVSISAVALSGLFGLLTVAAARRRGKALTSLGVSALLVGAAGWAAIEIGGRYVNDALNRTTGNVRQIADVMVGRAEASLHEWLDLTLVAGVMLVVFGVVVAVLGDVLKKS
jgi:hypothetical protein